MAERDVPDRAGHGADMPPVRENTEIMAGMGNTALGCAMTLRAHHDPEFSVYSRHYAPNLFQTKIAGVETK